MNMLDRIISAVAPGLGAKRSQARLDMVRNEKIANVLAQGYGSHGASRSKNSMKMWTPDIGDADSDIHDYIEDLRARSRDLAMGGSIVSGAHKTIRTNVVGTGLKLKPAPDYEFLGMTEEQANTLNAEIKREWEIWAESKDCDASGMSDFYGLQQLAFLSAMQSGEVFGLLPYMPRPYSVYDLKVNLVEADRCSSPNNTNTKDIKYGVELDEQGMVKAYHFSSHHPGGTEVYWGHQYTWQRVEARGGLTGRANVLHLMEKERPGQLRGVPIIAPVIEALKKLDRYTESELTAAAIQSMFTVFIESEKDDPGGGLGLDVPDIDNVDPENQGPTDDIRMGEGAVQFLEPGEKATFANPTRPNANFDPFVTAILRQIGSALEIPYELLVKHFTSSYSASRAALLEAWKMFRVRRDWLSKNFCQPIYEQFFIEAVGKGRINAPGLFFDPAIFRAYTKAQWHGPSQGMLDPVKEADAAVIRIENNFSTAERETVELTGGNWEENVRQRARENAVLAKYGVTEGKPQPAVASSALPSNNGDEDEDEDDGEGGEQ